MANPEPQTIRDDLPLRTCYPTGWWSQLNCVQKLLSPLLDLLWLVNGISTRLWQAPILLNSITQYNQHSTVLNNAQLLSLLCLCWGLELGALWSVVSPAKKTSYVLYVKHCFHLTVSDQDISTLKGWLLHILSILLYILRTMSNLTGASTIPSLTACAMPAPYEIHHFHHQRVWSFCGHFNRTKKTRTAFNRTCKMLVFGRVATPMV